MKQPERYTNREGASHAGSGYAAHRGPNQFGRANATERLGSEDRTLWILDHLDKYLERWLGFAAMSVEPRALIQSDLFTITEIAVEALEQEYARVSGSGRHLEDMRKALEDLRKRGNADHALALKEVASKLRSNLATHSFGDPGSSPAE
ncbi:MAG TPA: hypothetical protein VFS20_16260 [Longimicrobium sp.]|nr:hypothetical protein [Longimicrobium sp.]